MKHTGYIITVLLSILAVSACKKNYVPISEHPFDISISKIEANRVVIDIIPDNNDFHYMFGVATQALEKKDEAEFVNSVDNFVKNEYKDLFETTSLDRFTEYLYHGAYDEVYHHLSPDTKYYVYAFPYDGTEPMVDKFTKIEFNTPDIVKSDNIFQVSVDGTVISVSPSNNDGYFYDFCTNSELGDYEGSIDYFYRKTIDIYWEYDFLDTFILNGPSTQDIRNYYPDVADGDKFYLAISGYDKGITTTVTLYVITIHQGGTVNSTIEIIPDFSHTQ